MRKSAVLQHFQNNQSAVARHLGISQAAVAQWGDIIPKGSALELARTTELTYDPSLYAQSRKGGASVK